MTARALPLAALLAVSACAGAGQNLPTRAAVPAMPTEAELDAGDRDLASPLNNPIAGAARRPKVAGGGRPPSLEALMALRPSAIAGEGAEGLRAQAVCQHAESYGVQGGMAARGFALEQLLRRHERELDIAFDFNPVVQQVAPRTFMVPPVVTEAQMAAAVSDNGQTARASARVYEITRAGKLALGPPDWRSYLVPQAADPQPPPDALRPRTDKEAAVFRGCVAKGWAEGEALTQDTFDNGLGALQQDLIGMARYSVLSARGLVEPVKVARRFMKVEGSGGKMRVDDTTTTVTAPGRLQTDPGRWRATPEIPAGGPIGTIGGAR